MNGAWPTFTVGTIEASTPPKIEVIDAKVSRIRCIWQRVATTIKLTIPGIPPDFWAEGGYIKAIHEDGAVDILTPPRPEEEPDTFFAVRPGRGHDTIRLVAVNGAGEEGEETVLPVKWWWPKRKPLSKENQCDG